MEGKPVGLSPREAHERAAVGLLDAGTVPKAVGAFKCFDLLLRYLRPFLRSYRTLRIPEDPLMPFANNGGEELAEQCVALIAYARTVLFPLSGHGSALGERSTGEEALIGRLDKLPDALQCGLNG